MSGPDNTKPGVDHDEPWNGDDWFALAAAAVIFMAGFVAGALLV